MTQNPNLFDDQPPDNNQLNNNEVIFERSQKLARELPRLRQWLANRRPKRPLIIEFAGMPKAGKSSAIENLRHFFSHAWMLVDVLQIDKGFRVDTPAEGVSQRTPHYLQENLFDYNTWAGSYALQQLLQAHHDAFHDVVLLDRGPWDASCWLQEIINDQPSHMEGKDSSGAKQTQEFFRQPIWSSITDLHVVLTVEPDVARTREEQQRMIKHHGGTTAKKDMMSRMKMIYEDEFDVLLQKKREHCCTNRAIHIDTSASNDKREIALKILDEVFQVIDNKLLESDGGPLNERFVSEFLSRYTANEKTDPAVQSEFAQILTSDLLEPAGHLDDWRRYELHRRLAGLDVGGAILHRYNSKDLSVELQKLIQEVRVLK